MAPSLYQMTLAGRYSETMSAPFFRGSPRGFTVRDRFGHGCPVAGTIAHAGVPFSDLTSEGSI